MNNKNPNPKLVAAIAVAADHATTTSLRKMMRLVVIVVLAAAIGSSTTTPPNIAMLSVRAEDGVESQQTAAEEEVEVVDDRIDEVY